MILNIGVEDVPEVESDITTGDLAEILESQYGLFSNFVAFGLLDIADILADSMEKEINNIILGKPPGEMVLGSAMAEIEDRFKKDYLSEGGVEKIGIPGIPTEAAIKGTSRRFKGRKNKAGRRASFIDTGTLSASMKAWIE
jgi:hypothetical protein